MRQWLLIFSLAVLLASFSSLLMSSNQYQTLQNEIVFSVDDDGDGFDSDDQCPSVAGNSTIDRVGCFDGDGDGYSDADATWNLTDGADAFPQHSGAWSDIDGDGFADQPNLVITDDCPTRFGKSKLIKSGCSDMDLDWIPDSLDTDIDGDGISNELEIASSTALFQYDPMDPESFPIDSDFDTIPDAVDDDDDNDGWPDSVEHDRGTDPLDVDKTPFNAYLGTSTGFFYLGGFSTSPDYNAEAIEISASALVEIATGELVIPLLLVPIYLYAYVSRRIRFNNLLQEVSNSKTAGCLLILEKTVNRTIENRKIKTIHGLILRNKIEEMENNLRQKDKLLGLDESCIDEQE